MSDTFSWLPAVGALTLVAVAAVAIVLATHRGSGPVRVPPVPHAATPAQQARNLEAWLTRYSS